MWLYCPPSTVRLNRALSVDTRSVPMNERNLCCPVLYLGFNSGKSRLDQVLRHALSGPCNEDSHPSLPGGRAPESVKSNSARSPR